MNVSSYIFQSPSPQQVQIGRPDPSVAKEETSTQTDTQENSQAVAETQQLNIEEPERLNLTSPNQILDIYV